jgi:uncharacterized protein
MFKLLTQVLVGDKGGGILAETKVRIWVSCMDAQRMVQVRDLGEKDCKAVLSAVGYGHLGCSHNDEPYVIPIHYSYADPHIYIYTTEGKKFQILSENPKICLQVESVEDDRHWKSVIVTGEAVQVTDSNERENALDIILEKHPTLTPAMSIRWMDSWVRENIGVVYRITALTTTGRATAPR